MNGQTWLTFGWPHLPQRYFPRLDELFFLPPVRVLEPVLGSEDADLAGLGSRAGVA
jgi:hypothetical protein